MQRTDEVLFSNIIRKLWFNKAKEAKILEGISVEKGSLK